MRHAKWLLVAALAAGACQSHKNCTNAVNRDGSSATGGGGNSVLTIEKVVPSDLCVDQSFTYSILVKNVSKDARLDDVVVSDTLPGEGFQFESATPEAMRAGRDLKWNVGTMRPGTSQEFVVRGRAVSAMDSMPCANVRFGPLPKAAEPAPKPAPATPEARLALTKMAPADVCVMDDIPIKLVVKNTGNGKATGVKVDDQLPDGWTVNGQKSVSFNVGDLAPGAQKELTASARSARTGHFTNNATATGAGGLTASASSETGVHKAMLEITKTASRPSQVIGTRPATFTITVKNTGDWPAGNCTVRDTMTGADSVSEISDKGTSSGGAVVWNLGDLAPGASRTVTVNATRATTGALENTATATARCADPVSATARTEFVGIPAVLLEVVDSPDPVAVGGTTTYTITVTNQGSASDSDVVITCEYEAGVEFVSAGGATNGTASNGKITFQPLATIAPKATVKWTVTMRGTKAADTRFKVALNTHETGRPIDETEATRFYE